MENQESVRQLSPFELLPGELRNLIYRHAFVEECMVMAATCIDTDNKLWRSNEPPIARTCKLFRKEALEIYYKENTFTFPKSDPQFVHRAHIELWLLAIGDSISLIEWVGAELNIQRENPDGTHSFEGCQVRARIPDDINPATDGPVERPINQPCECGLEDPALCFRVTPVEYNTSNSLKEHCECGQDALKVCYKVLETLPRASRLSYAMHFCHNFLCWRNGWSSPSRYSRSQICRACRKPCVHNKAFPDEHHCE